MRVVLAVTVFLVGCGAHSVADAGQETPVLDSGTLVDKSASCASAFGSALTDAFGRVDGTIVAGVPPGSSCPLPNSDHYVLQVRFAGDVYRLVVNVQSDSGDPAIRMQSLNAPLPAPAFSEGWHPDLTLDYVTNLGLHSEGGWTALSLADASRRIDGLVTVGSAVSVYATSSGGAYAASAHLVHRNKNGHDGAIVFEPQSTQPMWLLFDFADQTF